LFIGGLPISVPLQPAKFSVGFECALDRHVNDDPGRLAINRHKGATDDRIHHIKKTVRHFVRAWLHQQGAIMTSKTSRRAVLAGAAALPALSLPAIAITAQVDPIFAAIEEYRKSLATWLRIYGTLDNAKGEARTKHGNRPSELITWRGSYIGGSETDQRREELLSEPDVDRKQIEREYLDAKARERAQIRAGVEWDNMTGIAPLREQSDRASDAEKTAAMTMARTKPRTAAGAGALVAYVVKDMEIGETEWHEIALATAAAALQSMSV
jgi:hypothetical protein